MKIALGAMPNTRGVLAPVGNWSARMPGRLQNRLLNFERTIASFHQRRWS